MANILILAKVDGNAGDSRCSVVPSDWDCNLFVQEFIVENGLEREVFQNRQSDWYQTEIKQSINPTFQKNFY